MYRQAGVTAVAAVLALGAVPAVADDLRSARGSTSQGLRVSAYVRPDDSVVLLSVRYVADCRKRGRTVRGRALWRDAGDARFTRSGATFARKGRWVHDPRGRGRRVIDHAMTGAPSGSGWAGTFSLRVRVKNRTGKTIDLCKTGRLRWRVGAAKDR